MCNILFSDAILEYKLYEALKFIMLYQVTEVYEQMKTKKVIPSLFRLLFSRETSSDPLSFMMNHLNSVGDTCGLEQVTGAEDSSSGPHWQCLDTQLCEVCSQWW